MFEFLKKRPLLDDESVNWLLDTTEWLLHRVDQGYLQRSAVLVLPSNAFFPGRESSAEGMAQLILDQVARHAGVDHWPCQAIEEALWDPVSHQPAELPVPAEPAPNGQAQSGESAAALGVPYSPGLLRDPQGLIASYSHSLAEYLCRYSGQTRPGEAQLWPVISELQAVMRGFGIMIANSAFTFRGGCGGCRSSGREAFLSQDEAVFALALFCELKGIANEAVLPHLKKHLKPLFKRARRDLSAREVALGRLQAACGGGPRLP